MHFTIFPYSCQVCFSTYHTLQLDFEHLLHKNFPPSPIIKRSWPFYIPIIIVMVIIEIMFETVEKTEIGQRKARAVTDREGRVPKLPIPKDANIARVSRAWGLALSWISKILSVTITCLLFWIALHSFCRVWP